MESTVLFDFEKTKRRTLRDVDVSVRVDDTLWAKPRILTLATVRVYARGKAPFIGIPVFSKDMGCYITAVFRRKHLLAALECPTITRAWYSERLGKLILADDERKSSAYLLRNLKSPRNDPRQPTSEEIVRELKSWAKRLRKTRKLGATPEKRREARREALEKECGLEIV
jgi:hypothetical protein